MRVLTTNLRDIEQFPATLFGDFYHQRRCIEEGDQRPPGQQHAAAGQSRQPCLYPFGTQATLAIVAAWAGGSLLVCRRAGSVRQANV